MSSAQTFEETSSVFDYLEGVTGLSEQCAIHEQDAVRTMTETSPFVLRIPCIIDTQFTTPTNKMQRLVPWIMTCITLDIPTRFGLQRTSSGNQTKTMQHKTKFSHFCAQLMWG